MPKKLIMPAVAVAALTSLVLANAVLAHSRPIRFDPAPGQVLEGVPSKVTGWFTGELRRDPNWNFLHVTDEQGNRVEAGETQIRSDRLEMFVPLKSDLRPGRYQVTWRSFDDEDGAILGDCYVFYVGQAAADQAAKDRQRLDGGGSRECARIDLEAANGTPVANGTPQGTVTAGDESDAGTTGSTKDDGGGVPAWSVVLAGVVGIVVGGAGMKFVGKRA
jgi:methionine-rich copper-binding protein CopC